ncbi:MAG TPA: TonB-dependent receptor [Puia sp.]|nr:TonB-dependent receptor [Puia sp.]
MNKYLRLIFVLFLAQLLAVGNLSAQNNAISGTVVDAETRAPIGFCSIIILNASSGATTDANGKFRLNVPENSASIKMAVSYLGYKTDTITIVPGKNNYLIALMRKQGILNEIVVTGVTKATLIKENPVAIVSVSQKAIEQTIEDNTIDAIAKNTPGLQTVKTGPNVSKPFINGLGYNRVLTLYDGILRVETQQWGDEHGVPMDDYIIDKAEVIEGPASLMYGSDAIAGVVSMLNAIPKETDGKIHGKFLSEYQTNNGLVGNSLTISQGFAHWSYALRGSERIAKNYTNPIDGRVYNTGFKMANASAFVGYKNANGYSHLNLTFYDNHQGIPDGSRDSLSRKFTYQVYESPGENIKLLQVDTIKNRPIVPNNLLNSYRLSPLSQRIQDYRVYADNFYHFGQSDIKVILGCEQNIRREFNHPADTKQAGEYIVLNTIDYGLRYNAPTFLNIELSAGTNGMYQTNSNKNATDFPIPDYHLFDFGTYVYGKWKHDKWTIAAGIRYDHRKERGDEMYVKADSSTGFYRQVSSNNTVGSIEQFHHFALTFVGVTGSIGSTYQITDQLSIKANIARGYRSPNITEIASNGLDPGAHIYYIGNLDFKPEFSLQEDMGVLGTFTNVSFAFSIFNNYIQHYIYEDQKVDASGNPVVIIPGNKTFQYQQTNARLYGMNASVNFHPENWKAFEFNNSFSLVYGYNLNTKYKGAGVNGEYLPFIPPPRWLGSINYNIPVKNKTLPLLSVKAETDYNLAQNRYLGLYNTEMPTAAYALMNISVHADINYSKKQHMSFQLSVNNIFNTAYQNHLSRLQYFEYYTQSPNGHLGIYNMGRNVCMKMIMLF